VLRAGGIRTTAAAGDWNDPARYEGYKTQRFQTERSKVTKTKRFGDYTLHLIPEDAEYGDIFVTLGSLVVASCYFGPHGTNSASAFMEGAPEVHPAHRRKGIASAIYDWIEEISGKKVAPADSNSADAAALWRSRTAAREMTWAQVAAKYPIYAGFGMDSSVQELALGAPDWDGQSGADEIRFVEEPVEVAKVRFARRPLGDERTKALLEAAEQGRPVPPVLVVRRAGQEMVSDGNHRLTVAEERGLRTTPAIVAISPRTDRYAGRGAVGYAKTAMPSWRDRGVLPAVECVIAPDIGRSSRNSYLVYLYDQPHARRDTLEAAKATVEEIYGPLDWQRMEGDDDPHHDHVWGWTTMFNDAPYYLVVETLPRLGSTGGLSQVDFEHGPEVSSAHTGARGVDRGHARGVDVGPDHRGRDHHDRRDRGRAASAGPRPGGVRSPLRVAARAEVSIGGPLALVFNEYSAERRKKILGAMKAFRDGKVHPDRKDRPPLLGCFTIPVGGLTTAEPDRLLLVRTKDGGWLAVYAVVNHNYRPAEQHIPVWLASKHAKHVRLGARVAYNLSYYKIDWAWQERLDRQAGGRGQHDLTKKRTMPLLERLGRQILDDHGHRETDLEISRQSLGESEADYNFDLDSAFLFFDDEMRNKWTLLHEMAHVLDLIEVTGAWEDHGDYFKRRFSGLLKRYGGVDVDLNERPNTPPARKAPSNLKVRTSMTESAKSIPIGDDITSPLWDGPGIYEVDISRISSTRCVALLTRFPGMGAFPIGFLTWDTERHSIEGIFVNEDYRGKGIGVEMKKAAERAAGYALNADSGEYTREGLAWAKKHGIPKAKNTSPVSDAQMSRMRAQMVNYLMGCDDLIKRLLLKV
jgi:GNAT superfamily N-acetyltransferase